MAKRRPPTTIAEKPRRPSVAVHPSARKTILGLGLALLTALTAALATLAQERKAAVDRFDALFDTISAATATMALTSQTMRDALDRQEERLVYLYSDSIDEGQNHALSFARAARTDSARISGVASSLPDNGQREEMLAYATSLHHEAVLWDQCAIDCTRLDSLYRYYWSFIQTSSIGRTRSVLSVEKSEAYMRRIQDRATAVERLNSLIAAAGSGLVLVVVGILLTTFKYRSGE